MAHSQHEHHHSGHDHMEHHDMSQADYTLMNEGINSTLRQGNGDHKSHASHGSMMAMTFHGGYVETILFSWWDVKEIGPFIGSFIAIFIMALLYEGLKYYRKHLLWKSYAGLQYCAVAPPDKGVQNICSPDEPQVIQPTMLSGAHAYQTVLHGLQVFISYMLMLVFMTYNTWLCVAVVLGSATGYFLFGWRESVVVDFTEHCH
ncbi:high affinity copper uptake protein 1-like isoform X2 [Cydia fagiglandana]|uniref:high affinity copper uptake protein 1-like isoform X2 n=1 Tax=Cydia fagiglandana TaxID=1458189 RepID=UPI002FEDF313